MKIKFNEHGLGRRIQDAFSEFGGAVAYVLGAVKAEIQGRYIDPARRYFLLRFRP